MIPRPSRQHARDHGIPRTPECAQVRSEVDGLQRVEEWVQRNPALKLNCLRLEAAKVTENANRPDAGKMTYRRFTEIWILRNGAWKKVVCHANHLDSG